MIPTQESREILGFVLSFARNYHHAAAVGVSMRRQKIISRNSAIRRQEFLIGAHI